MFDIRRGLFVTACLCPHMAMAAKDPPYIGSWDCEVAIFVFTATTYDPGDGSIAVRNVEKQDGNYILSFDEDYRIGLSGVTAKTMTWNSMATGDMFECKRIGK